MKAASFIKFNTIPLALCLFFLLQSCSESPKNAGVSSLNFPDRPEPKGYVCYRTTVSVNIDGILDEKPWRMFRGRIILLTSKDHQNLFRG